LATLVKAGLPITQALSTAIEQVTDKNFKGKLEKVAASVEGGQTLADSFAQYPDTFNTVYISLVHAGEESGTLDDSLERLADQQEKEQQIISKVRGALIYPALVLVVIVGVMAFMLASVMPQIAGLYTELKKPLPIVTQITLSISTFATTYWPITILLILALVFGIRAYFRTPNGRKVWDRTKLTMPVFGTLFRKVYMARFTRTLGSLVTTGVPLLEALNISALAMNNVILKQIVLQASEEVKTGKSLSSSLSKNPYFLKLVPQMIKVGEESGTLGAMLDKVASFYEDEVDQAVKNMSTIIEPVLMIVLGFMVAFIIVAILYPVYSLVGGGVDLNTSKNTTQTK
jgi:type IV pilus assembly protein PilC